MYERCALLSQRRRVSEAVSDVVGVTNSLLFRAPQSEDAVSESLDLRQLDETHYYIRGLKLLVYEALSYLLLVT